MWKTGVLAIIGIGVFTGLQLAPIWGKPDPGTVETPFVPDELARQALEREVEVAKALGFKEDFREERRIDDSWYHVLELEKQECLAVIATNAEHGQLHWLSISDEDEEVARDNGPRPVLHAQGCFEKGGDYRLRAWVSWGESLPDHTLRVVVLRAPLAVIGGNEKLVRGWVPRAP